MRLYDTRGGANASATKVCISVARSLEDLGKIFALRGAGYLSQDEYSYADNFDGNDVSATHLIAHRGEEPVGSIRIRYFADFCRLDRLVVRPSQRKSRAAFLLVQAAFQFCRDKGYRNLIGSAREDMIPFWAHFGGKIREDRPVTTIFGKKHYEMWIEFPRANQSLSIDTEVSVLLKPDGQWFRDGERSAA